ncbi:MAG: hypothetical protein EOP48_00730 [Sphingobacteriales bacterium]|nr:MAG: hypothetical protein EOP48_00730 [Sphingobacteriales bacterium]
MDRIQFSDEGWIHTKDFIKGPGNTIEDFDWDPTGQYLAMINYSNVIAIYDFHSITPLFFIYDSFDHIKGIRWLDIKDERAYPLDFVVVGRCGKPRVYRFINEQIMALGFLDDTGVE